MRHACVLVKMHQWLVSWVGGWALGGWVGGWVGGCGL